MSAGNTIDWKFCTGAVIGEYVAAERGLGYLQMQANSQFDTTLLFAALLAISAVGVALYFAVIFIILLAWDGWKSLWFMGSDGQRHFGVGVGSLVLILNPILLGLYTFGCHSMRHLVGGRKDILSDSPTRKKCYDCVSGLNKKHMLYAWISMFYVGFVDIYVRMCAKGVWTDLRIF